MFFAASPTANYRHSAVVVSVNKTEGMAYVAGHSPGVYGMHRKNCEKRLKRLFVCFFVCVLLLLNRQTIEGELRIRNLSSHDLVKSSCYHSEILFDGNMLKLHALFTHFLPSFTGIKYLFFLENKPYCVFVMHA